MTDAIGGDEVEAVARAIWNAKHPLCLWDDADAGPRKAERDKIIAGSRAAIAALDVARGDGWHLIEDVNEDDGTQVLAAFHGQFGWVQFIATVFHDGVSALGYAPPTYFRPLPPAPGDAK
jgi:hypothetical protein